jgi:hypothetical protein
LLTPQDGVPAVLLSLPIVPNNQKTKTRFPNWVSCCRDTPKMAFAKWQTT